MTFNPEMLQPFSFPILSCLVISYHLRNIFPNSKDKSEDVFVLIFEHINFDGDIVRHRSKVTAT